VRMLSRLRFEEDGATAVEFAIICPIFFVMLIGIVQISIAFFHGSTVQWAVDRAMRVAMVDADITSTEIQALVEEDLGVIGTPDIDVTYTVDNSSEIALAHVVANYEIPVQILFVPEFTMEFSVESFVPVPSA
jgi:Flp pilus assembly protein TadG